MKKRKSSAKSKAQQHTSQAVHGNYATPPLDNKVPPTYLTYPLNCFEKREINGRQVLRISEQDVLRMREFDIENKK